MSIKDEDSKSRHILASVRNLALGYGDQMLFTDINFDLREGESLELRGRNGCGKTTLIKALLGDKAPTVFCGELFLDSHVRVGVYEQEVPPKYFDLTLADAIERMYLDRNLPISTSKVRSLMSDYLFSESDGQIPLSVLSGGQKARFQLITMLANNPQLLILDEPTNHLDLPSIEELETALAKYSGAILFVSHDGYFRQAINGTYIKIG